MGGKPLLRGINESCVYLLASKSNVNTQSLSVPLITLKVLTRFQANVLLAF